MVNDPLIEQLHKLARLYGIQLAYYDVEGNRRHASPEALIKVLQAMGAPIEGLNEVPDALAARRDFLYNRFVGPVLVAWEGAPAGVKLRLPHDRADEHIRCHLRTEDGDVRNFIIDLSRISPLTVKEFDGTWYAVKRIFIPGQLPFGYHQLTVEAGSDRYRMMVIASPLTTFACSRSSSKKQWGVFVPLYALHSKRDWGAGDLGDLEDLIVRVAEAGGEVTATTPFLASFLNGVFDPSPYAPASRLFWNEMYIDVERVPELAHCREAQAIIESPDFQRELEALRASPLVDYRNHAAQKRRILERLAAFFFAIPPSFRHQQYQEYLESHPLAQEYARFQATCEAQGRPWPEWPSPLREGSLASQDYKAAVQYHLYAQWIIQEQIAAVTQRAEEMRHGLCLDMPLGVHRHSFDVWREQRLFSRDISVGAPPDPFFSKGQNWGFPPLHPQRLREQWYAYFIASLRTQLEHASFLRIDHVMGIHRLFWIPEGMEADQGVYVRYHPDEFYAIMCIESHRHDCLIIGENLGTVPFYVNASIARHHLLQMHILQYELPSEYSEALREVPANALAGLNTHDMPTFAAFWRGLDIDNRIQLGLLDHRCAQKEKRRRKRIKQICIQFLRQRGWQNDARTLPAVLRACLSYLCKSKVRIVLVNLEDLWFETLPQNIPGTGEDQPNWRRKIRHSLEMGWRRRFVREILRDIDEIRNSD